MTDGVTRLARIVIVTVGIVIAGVIAWWLFLELPTSITDLFGVLLVLVGIFIGARLAGRIAGSIFPSYNVAEVTVEGPITRTGGGLLPTKPGGVDADDVVEQIEHADEDNGAKALLLTLNTPGGEVVPSDDIRRAAEAFSGPTIAHATDVCASGGYWIASGCDELWTRELSLVGSIGVFGSIVNASELADRLGLSYERFTAGRFKDAGSPLREIRDDEREYLQGLIDGLYDQFVDRITESRKIDSETIESTEARIYLGADAEELGLVDVIGTRDDVEERIEELLDEEVVIQPFEPERGLADRLRTASTGLATAFGTGLANALIDSDDGHLRIR